MEAQSSPTQYRGALISIEIDRQLITSEEDHENIKKPYGDQVIVFVKKPKSKQKHFSVVGA